MSRVTVWYLRAFKNHHQPLPLRSENSTPSRGSARLPVFTTSRIASSLSTPPCLSAVLSASNLLGVEEQEDYKDDEERDGDWTGRGGRCRITRCT